jgi:hypothetical protein
VRVKPFIHVVLESVFGMLVFEDIGHFASTSMIRRDRPVESLRGTPWKAKGVPK